MRTRVLLIAAAAFMLMLPAPAVGQVNVGPQLSYGDDTDVGIGGRVVLNVESLEHWDFIGSFDVFFPDNFDYWELNGNLAYNFVIEDAESLYPYAGGGLNIANFDSDGPGDSETELGINAFLGSKFATESSITPFLELRLVIEAAEQVVLTGGILF